MKKFRVRLTRDCTFTQSVDVVLEVGERSEVLDAACLINQDKYSGWVDDDDSFHFGEQGVYIADPAAIEEVPKAKEVPVCSHCGSENISADAAVRWSIPDQDWEVTNVFDKGHSCDDCGGECSLVFKEIP